MTDCEFQSLMSWYINESICAALHAWRTDHLIQLARAIDDELTRRAPEKERDGQCDDHCG
jgi:hypothetical protein